MLDNSAEVFVIRVESERVLHHVVHVVVVEKQVVVLHNVANAADTAKAQRKRLQIGQFVENMLRAVHLRFQAPTERVILRQSRRAFQNALHFIDRLAQIRAHHYQVIVYHVDVLVEPVARHRVLVHLNAVEHDRRQDVNLFFHTDAVEFGEQLSDRVAGCQHFKHFQVLVGADIDPARFKNEERHNQHEYRHHQRNQRGRYVVNCENL